MNKLRGVLFESLQIGTTWLVNVNILKHGYARGQDGLKLTWSDFRRAEECEMRNEPFEEVWGPRHHGNGGT